MAGEYIEFNNNTQPAVNDANLNRLQQLIKQDIRGAVSGDTLPVGAIIPFGSDTIPENWLLCDGQAVNRTNYQQLFNTIGTTFGQGDGFSTFNLPNLKGKVVVGKDTEDTAFDLLGETGGEKEHTLTLNEIPSNNIQTTSSGNNADGYIGRGGYTPNGNYNFGGQGKPHNVLQPYQVQNYIIKAKQSAGIVATVIDELTSTSQTDALSANQGKVLNEKIKSKYILATINTNPNIGSSFQVPLNTVSANVGNKFTVSNNVINVGSGVSKVRVSASIFVEGPQGVGYIWGQIRKNDITQSGSIVPYNNGGGFLSTNIPTTIFNVQEGDKIKLIADSTCQGNLRRDVANTWILVEVIE